ncbi:MAG: XRE family transcriptional regulator [Bryobacterales bacterium]|nr:XRE family transcriptional regulator [Bryobacterales bacterium]
MTENRARAHDRTGIAAADFSRIRNPDPGRFTVDRLMSIINLLGSLIEVKVRVHPAQTAAREARPQAASALPALASGVRRLD